MSSLNNILPTLTPISLSEMDRVQLLNRTDTKFIFNSELYPTLLQQLDQHYRILEVNGHRASRYRSLYFDTEDFGFYRKHHNGGLNRYKVRMRKYLESDLTFFEVKFKTNKGRTDKKRIRIADLSTELPPEAVDFIRENYPFDPAVLKPKLYNTFSRMTLVHRELPERITLDAELAYESTDGTKKIDGLAIAEAKQERINSQSDFFVAIRNAGVRPEGMSKYCVGCVLLYPSLRYNNFKPRLLKINKITHGAHW